MYWKSKKINVFAFYDFYFKKCPSNTENYQWRLISHQLKIVQFMSIQDFKAK